MSSFDVFMRTPYVAAQAVPLVGRQPTVEQISALIQQIKKSVLIYITGIGGIGKTRLLDYLLITLRQDSKLLVANELIDLYDADNATVEGMVSAIVKVLTNDETAFVGYRTLRAQLNFVRATRPNDKGVIIKLRETMLRQFISDANALSHQRRLVIALDTAEKLDLQHSEIAEQLGISEGHSETVARLCAAVSTLDNAIIILAGRPGNNYLHDELAARLPEQFYHFPLKGLTRTAAEDYFKEVITQLQASEKSSDQRTAKSLQGAQTSPHSIFQALYDDPANGEEPTVRPIMLALAIDLVATDLTREHYKLLSTEVPLATEARAANRQQLGASIIGVNRNDPSADEELILLLGWLRKGADPKLLYQLLCLKYDITPADFEATLTNIQRLSFIKQRADGRIFLHDEMYDLVQSYGASDADRERVFKLLRDYYADNIQKVRDLLSELTQQQATTAEEKAALANKTITAQNELRRLFVEEVHYRLRAHAGRGFQHYFRVSEEAVAAHDQELGALFRAEMEAFVVESRLKDKSAGFEGLQYADVVADEALRWIGWYHYEGEYETALHIAEMLQSSLNVTIQAGGSLAQAELDSWHGLVLTDLGNYIVAEPYLERAIKNLLTETSASMQKTVRWTGILARAYNNHGYMLSNLGRHYRAINAFNQALPLWRALRMDGEQSNTLNNLGFEYAEVGDFDSARRLVRDALTLRQRLNLRLPLGLTFSTLAGINIRAFSSEIAILEAEQAIAIFDELGYLRGRGLALRTLAEAKRRVSGSPATLHERRTVALLEESEEYAKQAAQIFSEQVNEPVRYVWSLVELGCVYREWLRYRIFNPDELSPDEISDKRPRLTIEHLYQKSANAFEQASAKAVEIQRTNHRLDALVNWAWLIYDRSFDTQTGEFKANAQQMWTNLYSQIEHFFDQRYGKRTPQFMHRLAIGTEARIVRDDYLIHLANWESFQGEMRFIRFHSTKKMIDLHIAAEHFTIALACYAHYGNDDVYQSRHSRNRLYDLLKDFDSATLFQIYTFAEESEELYGWQAHTSAIWEFLVNNFGPKEGHSSLNLDDDF